jgi:hypothetical protein
MSIVDAWGVSRENGTSSENMKISLVSHWIMYQQSFK